VCVQKEPGGRGRSTLAHPFLDVASTEHRKLIERGMRQRSMRGRVRYIARLMNRAGIGAGSLSVALP
jgi:hypothetical protein